MAQPGNRIRDAVTRTGAFGSWTAFLLVGALGSVAVEARAEADPARATCPIERVGVGWLPGVTEHFIDLPSVPGSAQPIDAPGDGGVLDGEAFRFSHMCLVERFLLDFVSIPAGIPRWNDGDWGAFALVAGSVFALMAPAAPSADVRLQEWLQQTLGPNHLEIWTALGAPIIWVVLSIAIVGGFAYGALAPDAHVLEGASLVLEALAVSQIFHLGLKLLIGREGPNQENDGLGTLYGPGRALQFFPDGTPSGHATTLGAVVGAATAYWDNPFLTVALYVLGGALGVALVTDNLHYASEVIFGGALGYFTGRWVVAHRSSRHRQSASLLDRVTIAPTAAPSCGQYSLAVGFAW